jgi:hypothetical protein
VEGWLQSGLLVYLLIELVQTNVVIDCCFNLLVNVVSLLCLVISRLVVVVCTMVVCNIESVVELVYPGAYSSSVGRLDTGPTFCEVVPGLSDLLVPY